MAGRPTARIYSHLVQEDVDDGGRLLPGNGVHQGRSAGEAAELQKRIAEMEEQLALLRRAVSGEGRQPVRRGRRRVAVEV